MQFGAAFIIGLLGSLHCVGMCGPIAMALPLTAKEKSKVIFQSFLYNLGRMTTYATMGLILGLMGWGIALAGYQKAFSIGLGALLIITAIFSISIEQKLFSNSVFRRGFNWVKTKLSKALSIKGNASAFKIGLLNGILPCGLVYIALAGAVASGTAIKGAIYMAAFGLGTLPMMLGVMVVSNFNKKVFFRFRRWIPVGLVVFGMFLVYRGIVIDMPADLSLWEAGGFKMKCH
jgi:sulfite exporter TauE/SafE